MRTLKNNGIIVLCTLTVCCVCMLGIIGCGGNTSTLAPATVNVADMTIEDYEAMLSDEEAVFAGVYEIEHMPEVELPDPAILPTEEEIQWEGYSEEELGLLEPYEMPYCEVGINGCSYVWYKDMQYFYVNEINQQAGESSPFYEYSNVWVTMDPENFLILGGWEEYGRTGNLVGGRTE